MINILLLVSNLVEVIWRLVFASFLAPQFLFAEYLNSFQCPLSKCHPRKIVEVDELFQLFNRQVSYRIYCIRYDPLDLYMEFENLQ